MGGVQRPRVEQVGVLLIGWRALRLVWAEGAQGVRWKSHGHSRGPWRALGGSMQSSDAIGPVQEQCGISGQDCSFAGAEKGPGSD